MIDGGILASVVGISGALVLVVAALRRRRVGGRPLLLLALAWAAIIIAAWAVARLGLNLT